MRRRNALIILLAIVAMDIAVIHLLRPQLIDQTLAAVLWALEVPVGLVLYRLDKAKKHTTKPETKPDGKHQAELVDIIKKLATIKPFEKKDHSMSLKVKQHQNLEDSNVNSETGSKGIVWQDIFDVDLLPKFIGHLQWSEYSNMRKNWNDLLDLCTRHNNMVRETGKNLESRIKKEMQKNFPDYAEFDQGIPFKPWYDISMANIFVFGNILDLVRGQKIELVLSSKEDDSKWTIVAHSTENDYIIAVTEKDDTDSLHKVLTSIRDSFEQDSFSNIIQMREKITNACLLFQKDIGQIIKEVDKGAPVKGTCGSCRTK